MIHHLKVNITGFKTIPNTIPIHCKHKAQIQILFLVSELFSDPVFPFDGVALRNSRAC
jgi:hypothetical protein